MAFRPMPVLDPFPAPQHHQPHALEGGWGMLSQPSGVDITPLAKAEQISMEAQNRSIQGRERLLDMAANVNNIRSKHFAHNLEKLERIQRSRERRANEGGGGFWGTVANVGKVLNPVAMAPKFAEEMFWTGPKKQGEAQARAAKAQREYDNLALAYGQY